MNSFKSAFQPLKFALAQLDGQMKIYKTKTTHTKIKMSTCITFIENNLIYMRTHNIIEHRTAPQNTTNKEKKI